MTPKQDLMSITSVSLAVDEEKMWSSDWW